MNAHTGALPRVEARRTIADRRPELPHRSVGEFVEAAERQASRRMLSDTGSSLERWVAVLRAAMRPEDVERLRADAERAVEQLPPGSYFQSAALRVLEVAHPLAGNEGSPDATAAQVKEQSDGEDLETIGFGMRLAASLTAAELRLLPLLATHLSLRGIGERLYISRNTVKTEAIAAYRKLGVSSRSEAVERAVELGLIEATAATGAGDPGRRPAVPQGQLSQLTLVLVVALLDGGLAPRTEAVA
jgi:DNA-binding CsgD family transcriptional regulator